MNKLQNVLSDEESMKQIRELADMLGTPKPPENTQADSPPHNLDPVKPNFDPVKPSFDPVKLMQLGQVLQTASQDDNNIRFLTALRPLLKEESQLKLDRVVKLYRLMNLYPALKQSGLGGGDILGLL